jgi:hypothetical protein
MTSADQHRAAWNARYAADYDTDAERDAAYLEAKTVLAELDSVFNGGNAGATPR